jgi:hypothetical protein
MRRVAVVTDAASPGYFFPAWHRYYGGLFGDENLFVLTYGGAADSFAGFRTRLTRSICPDFSDAVRVPYVTQFVALLLAHYDVVIRCDVDEFLLPDPSADPSLAAFAQRLADPYVTAIGLNVYETKGDRALDLQGAPLLDQRRHCVKDGAYSKTAIVRSPIAWSGGFHNASVPPRFGGLYLFHMKYADIAGRALWIDHLLATCTPHERPFQQTFLDNLKTASAWFDALPVADGWPAFQDDTFERRFLSGVEPPLPCENHYRQAWTKDDVGHRIPVAFGTPF